MRMFILRDDYNSSSFTKKKHLKLKLSIFHLPELRSFLQLAERRFSVVLKQSPFAVSRKTFRFTFWNFFLRYDPISIPFFTNQLG